MTNNNWLSLKLCYENVIAVKELYVKKDFPVPKGNLQLKIFG